MVELHFLSHTRGYTCGHCGKHWNKESMERRHNKSSCPYSKEQFGKIKKRTNKKKEPFVFQEGDTCTICQDSTDLDFRLFNCEHAFHKKCLIPWVNQCLTEMGKSTCPNCRNEISNRECKRLRTRVTQSSIRQTYRNIIPTRDNHTRYQSIRSNSVSLETRNPTFCTRIIRHPIIEFIVCLTIIILLITCIAMS